MDVTVLHVQGCPGAAVLRERLTSFEGTHDLRVEFHMISDHDEAVQARMTGSPTLLIDGVDPFTQEGQSAGISCRLYRDAAGQVSNAPSTDLLAVALAKRRTIFP